MAIHYTMNHETTLKLQTQEAPLPNSLIAELRMRLHGLGPPPTCLRYTGCLRLAYRAAQQIGAKITVQKQQDGAFLIWKLPVAAKSPHLLTVAKQMETAMSQQSRIDVQESPTTPAKRW